MTDWANLLNSDDFRAYRKKQAQAVTEIIARSVGQLTSGNAREIDKLTGQLDVISSLLRLPETLTGDEQLQATLEIQLQEDIGNITKYLIRKYTFREES